MLAAKEGEAELMRTLAAAGANLSLGLPDGSSPLVVAARGQQHARKNGTLTIVPGQRVNREPERRALGAMRVVFELGADINGADHAGNTAMHVAAQKRFESVIRFLAEKGARIDAKNQWGDTPLALAMRPLPPPSGTQVATLGMVLTDEGPKIAEVLRSLGATE